VLDLQDTIHYVEKLTILLAHIVCMLQLDNKLNIVEKCEILTVLLVKI
jgi:hypothetical protein